MGINTEQTKTTQIPEVTRRRIVDIHTYLPVLIDIIKSGKDVSVTVTGSSMAPFLAHLRDSIIVSPPPRQFHRGDMVFFQRQDGSYVMHRIHHLKEGKLYLVGDNQTEIEGPIDPEQGSCARSSAMASSCKKAISGGIFLKKHGSASFHCGRQL